MASTRKALERVPEGKTDWKPHPKSMTLARLARHIAELPGWVVETMKKDELDIGAQFTTFISSSPRGAATVSLRLSGIAVPGAVRAVGR
jgi:hypothetical protein